MNLEALRTAEPSVCPFHTAAAGARKLAPTDELVMPMARRAVVQYVKAAEGALELRLYYADKEIAFDEPELFAFGERLAKENRFLAGTATTWAEGCDLPRVRGMLEDLIAEGILRYADEWTEKAPVVGLAGVRPSPLAPATETRPRTWFESESIGQVLADRPLHLGHLELVIPIFRVAHMALDADGRQVGEANVFPPALRLDVPTRWRTCVYAGTRYQSDRPMNVTALKAMREHWGSMMAMLLAIRAAYLERFPSARDGWTVGHLERLSTAVLALPTYLLMRAEGRVANGDLHPALSSVFRVTDGLRMAMHQMLFVPFGEPTLAPDAPMTSAAILDYAERNYLFHSEHGVCAGPQAMIEEFLAVLVDGREPKGGLPARLDARIEEAIAAIAPAMDYGFLGLQAYGAIFSMWPAMTRAYETLASLADTWTDADGAAATMLRNRLRERVEQVRSAGFLATEDRRLDREVVYADMYAQCEIGRTGRAPRRGLVDLIAPRGELDDVYAFAILRGAIEARVPRATAADRERAESMLATLVGFLRRTRAILRTGATIQRRINTHLGRDEATRPVDARDIDIHNRLRGGPERRLPYLLDEIEELFGVRVHVDETRIVVETVNTAQRPVADALPDSEGVPSSDARAPRTFLL